MHDKRITDKRGVSPLIATVLLIAFAVALGAVVMNWGRSYVEETADIVKTKSDKDVKCSMDVSLKVAEINDVPQMCYGGSGDAGYMDFTVLNTGTKAIEEIDVVVIGSTSIYSNTTLNGTSIAVGGALHKNITYSYTTYGSVRQVRVLPNILLSGVSTPCAGNALVKDVADITNCSS